MSHAPIGNPMEASDADVETVAPPAAALARLATFPEDNPNLVIEVDLDGTVSYLNPVASARFPDLAELGAAHPLLRPLPGIVPSLLEGEHRFRSCEVVVGPAVFEAKVCLADVGEQRWIRMYANDVTAMREAERTVHALASRVVRAHEEERRRISRELHDEAGQALTALKIGLSLIQRDGALDAATLRENIDEAIALVDATHERIRSLAQGLRPASLDAVGLHATVEDLCREFAERIGLDIAFQADDLPELVDDIQICIYRLVQEALVNCARHSEAQHVDVHLRSQPGAVEVSIADDGRGARPEAFGIGSGHRAGMGLLGMRERVELLDGRLDIETGAGDGFRLVATIPIAET